MQQHVTHKFLNYGSVEKQIPESVRMNIGGEYMRLMEEYSKLHKIHAVRDIKFLKHMEAPVARI